MSIFKDVDLLSTIGGYKESFKDPEKLNAFFCENNVRGIRNEGNALSALVRLIYEASDKKKMSLQIFYALRNKALSFTTVASAKISLMSADYPSPEGYKAPGFRPVTLNNDKTIIEDVIDLLKEVVIFEGNKVHDIYYDSTCDNFVATNGRTMFILKKFFAWTFPKSFISTPPIKKGDDPVGLVRKADFELRYQNPIPQLSGQSMYSVDTQKLYNVSFFTSKLPYEKGNCKCVSFDTGETKRLVPADQLCSLMKCFLRLGIANVVLAHPGSAHSPFYFFYGTEMALIMPMRDGFSDYLTVPFYLNDRIK